MFFDDYPMVNLAGSRGSGSRPFGAPSYGRHNPYYNPYGYSQRQQYQNPFVSASGYDDSNYERERQRRAMLQARRQQQIEEEQQRYNAEISRRRELARQQQVETNRQRAIRAFHLKILSKYCTKIQRWWRDILEKRRADEELKRKEEDLLKLKHLQQKQAAAAFVVTRAMKRFCAVANARRIAKSLKRLQELTQEMNTVAPRDVSPPTDTKKRLLVEDTLEKIILKVDVVDTYGSKLVRRNRKRLVVDANERLRRLDESGPTMLNSPMITRKASSHSGSDASTTNGEGAVAVSEDVDMQPSESCDSEDALADVGGHSDVEMPEADAIENVGMDLIRSEESAEVDRAVEGQTTMAPEHGSDGDKDSCHSDHIGAMEDIPLREDIAMDTDGDATTAVDDNDASSSEDEDDGNIYVHIH